MNDLDNYLNDVNLVIGDRTEAEELYDNEVLDQLKETNDIIIALENAI